METSTTTLSIVDPKYDPQVQQQLKVVTEAIAVSLSVREVTIDFAKRRDELTSVVYAHTKAPINDQEMEVIRLDKRAVAKLRTEFEKNADALKSPLNAAVDNINGLKKAGIELLKKCEAHADGLINNYQNKLADARRVDELRVQRESEEIERQRLQAIREQEEAERKRQQAELARQRAEEANSPAAKLKAQQEEQRLKDEAAALDVSAYEKELTAAMAPAPVMVSAPAPQAKEIATFTLNGRNDFEKRQSLLILLHAMPHFFGATIHEEAPRSFSLGLKIKDLTDAINGVPPFEKLTGAPGITISTKLSTLR